jgi:hypothetical protein
VSDAPYNVTGQSVTTDAGAPNTLGQDFIAHFQVAAAKAVAANAAGVLASTPLAAAAEAITAGLTSPAFPRNVSITGNASGITGNVTAKGTNFAGAAISETIALSGTSTVAGNKAFKSVTEFDLPAQTHAPTLQVTTATVVGTISAAGTAQVETATIVGTVTLAGWANVIVTAAGMTGSPKTYQVAVALNDTASQVAAKAIAVLAADPVLTARYTVGGSGATITLTAVAPAVNDSALNISVDNNTCTGLTTEPTSANTTAGVRSGAGNAVVVVTGAPLAGSPKTFQVAVANGDSASTVAGKIRAVLAADGATTTAYAVSGATNAVILTANIAALNDATLNISVDNNTCTGLTTESTSAATTAGAADAVSVGLGSKLGIPYHRPRNSVLAAYLNNVLEATAPTVAFDAANVENNTITLNNALNGSQVDAYLIV